MGKFKKIINATLIIVIILVTIILARNYYLESQIEVREPGAMGIRVGSTKDEKLQIRKEPEEIQTIKEITNFDDLHGHSVIAKLEIPTLGLTTDVLEHYSEDALLISVTKFEGPRTK